VNEAFAYSAGDVGVEEEVGVAGVTGIAPVATPLRALGSAMGEAGFGCALVAARFSVDATGRFVAGAGALAPVDEADVRGRVVLGLPEAAASTDFAFVMA